MMPFTEAWCELRRITLPRTQLNKPASMRQTPPGGIMLVLPPPWRKPELARGETPIPVEENMALVRRFLEARVEGDLDAIDQMMAPDFVNHTKLLPGEEPGREGAKRA